MGSNNIFGPCTTGRIRLGFEVTSQTKDDGDAMDECHATKSFHRRLTLIPDIMGSLDPIQPRMDDELVDEDNTVKFPLQKRVTLNSAFSLSRLEYFHTVENISLFFVKNRCFTISIPMIHRSDG